MMKNVLLSGVAAITVFAGLSAAPLALAPATAQQIVIDPPKGAPVSFADLIEKVSPAVVSIEARGKVGGDDEEPAIPPGLENVPGFEEFLRRFREEQRRQPQPQSVSLGSGFFISAEGIVVTNEHVIDGADEITVRDTSGNEYKATLVGKDDGTDLAVLRVKADKRFPFVTFDREADLRVGDWVVAVGNPFGLEGSATAGIVSGKARASFDNNPNRSYVQFLQIDAPINRGNSGGPTFDLRGRVVGVNSQIISPTGGNVGIGFAIPSETAANIVEQLLKNGKVTRGWLGVTISSADDDLAESYGLAKSRGAVVVSLDPAGPAAKAGVKKEDLIVGINGEEVADSGDLTRKVASATVGSKAEIEVIRGGGERRKLTVTLDERPSTEQLQAAARAGVDAPEEPGAGAEQPKLGVSVRPLNREERRARAEGGAGLVITEVKEGSVLQEKGLAPGDALLRASGRPLSTIGDLNAAVEAAVNAKRPLRLEVERNGQTSFIAADLNEE